MNPNGPWHVHTLGGRTGCEVSIIREGFKHGHVSWGWDGPDWKIILAKDGTDWSPISDEKWQRWHEMAETMAQALNDRETVYREKL